jgi:hypothetical protein
MIPTKPPPTLKVLEDWSYNFTDFIAKCLIKNPDERSAAEALLQVWFSPLVTLLLWFEMVICFSISLFQLPKDLLP